MKFAFKLRRPYQPFHKPRGWSLADKPYILPLIGLLIGVLSVGVVLAFNGRSGFRPSSSHVVFVVDNGKQSTVDTKLQTVGELLAKLPLHLIPQDVVEPSRDTRIIEDNFRINIYRARPVTVVIDGQKTVTLTGQRSARVIAASAGLNVYAEDAATFESGEIASGIIGEEVVVKRSMPVNLNLYGTQITVRTLAKTVSGLLKEKGINLVAGDTVKPGLNTKLKSKSQVFVLRKGTNIVTVAKTVPAPLQVIKDNSLTFGISVVRQAGQPGKKLITYEVSKVNGRAVRRQIQVAVVQDPVPQIIARGTNVDIPLSKTGIMAAAGLSSSDYPYANYIISNESGWCATKWQGQYGTCPAYHGAPNYGGYGLCQSTPPQKMAAAGSDWPWNPVTQMRWCDSYAQGAYGGWANAYNHWLANHNW